MPIKYRADIDGLRAIAVLSVIFFHTGIPGFSGGFVGVDVFFVISGYLITSIILKDIQSGQFSISRFYERRIRRIFPALFPVIVFTIVVATFLFDPISFESFGKSITATTVFGSNILFWKESGYFDISSITKPLLHTWSLAVEEQFYIFFPLLLIAINRFLKNRYLLWIIGIGFISLLSSIYGVYTYQVATFYLVHTRAWELLFGSLLSLGAIPELKSNVHRNIVSIIGLGLIVFSVSFYTESTIFPGISAMSPVLGSSLIIYSGMGAGRTIIKKFLSLKPIVFIGLISYSLYLWHWPLIVFSKYLLFRDLTPFEITGIIFATFAISILSLKFIEQPFRGTRPIIPERKQLFALSAGVMVIASIIGAVIFYQKGMPNRYQGINPNFAEQFKNDSEWIFFQSNMKNIERLNQGITPPIIGAKNVIPSFILWGDSHAGMLIPAVSKTSNKYKLSGFVVAHNTCLPLLKIDYMAGSLHVAGYNQNVIDFIKAHPNIKTVIIAAYWTTNQDVSWFGDSNRVLHDIGGEYTGNQPYSILLQAGLVRVVKTLSNYGCKVVLVSDVPVFNERVNPIKIFWRYTFFGAVPDYEQILPTMSEYATRNKDISEIFGQLSRRSNVTVLHPESMLFDKKRKAMLIFNDNLLYRDNIHLSKSGANFVAPVFDEVFKKMAKSTVSGSSLNLRTLP